MDRPTWATKTFQVSPPPLTFCGICIKIQFYSMLNNTDKVYDFSDDWDNKYTFAHFSHLEEQSNYRSITIFHYKLVCAGLYKTYYKGQMATFKLLSYFCGDDLECPINCLKFVRQKGQTKKFYLVEPTIIHKIPTFI